MPNVAAIFANLHSLQMDGLALPGLQGLFSRGMCFRHLLCLCASWHSTLSGKTAVTLASFGLSVPFKRMLDELRRALHIVEQSYLWTCKCISKGRSDAVVQSLLELLVQTRRTQPPSLSHHMIHRSFRRQAGMLARRSSHSSCNYCIRVL